MNTNPNHDDADPIFGPVIHSYSRAQAIQDGNLVDVGQMGREAGFKWPVALTVSAWNCCVKWSADDSERQVYQDESGRLWDVLFMACYAIRLAQNSGDQLLFPVMRVPRDGHSTSSCEVALKLVVGPGDSGEPVVTIMLPNED